MKKKILFVILLVLVVTGVFVIKSGVQTTRNVVIVKGLFEKIAASQTLSGIQAYPPPPRTLEMTDEEVNAGLNLLCGLGNPVIQVVNFVKNLTGCKEPTPIQPEIIALPCQYFRNFKVKFSNGKYLAKARLLKPVKGNVEVEGTLSLRDERNVDVKFEKVLLDNQPASPETASQLENIAQQEINGIAGRMKDLALQEITVSEGKIIFKGIFSFDELLCSLGLKNYCPIEANEVKMPEVKSPEEVPANPEEVLPVPGGAFIRDKLELDIDQDGKNEILALYVLSAKIEEDPSPWCGNISGEKLRGDFYLALIDQDKLQSQVKLIPEWFENGGKSKNEKLINPRDLNGDGKELEFTFGRYAGCNGEEQQIVGYSFNDKKLKNFPFYKDKNEEIAVFISDSQKYPGLVYENGFLIRRFYSQIDGDHKVYYEWNSGLDKFFFQKEEISR